MADATYDLNEIKRRMQGALGVAQAGTERFAHRARLDGACWSMFRPKLMASTCRSISSRPLRVPEPRLLSVQVWDKSMVKAVEKAIIAANLGLDTVDRRPGDPAAPAGTQRGSAQGTRQDRAQICRSGARRGAPRAPRRPRGAQENGEGQENQRGRSHAACPPRCRRRPIRPSATSTSRSRAKKKKS